MKWISTLLLFISLSVSASELNVSYTGNYRSYNEYLQREVDDMTMVMDRYLEEMLNCGRVKSSLKIDKKPGLFSSGQFTVTLKASCQQSFEKFHFNYYPPFDWEDYNEVVFSYVQDGKVTKKNLKWNIGSRTVHEDREVR